MTAPRPVGSTAQDQSAEVLGTAKDQAANVKASAVGAGSDVAGTAKEQAGNVVGETLAQAKDLTAQVKDQASQQLDMQSSKALESVRGVSSQLTAGDTSGMVGQFMTEAGQRLQSFSDYVERVGPQGVMEDVRRYARRNPGTFVLGAALAGLVSGRVTKGIKASQDFSSSSTPAALTGTAAGTPPAGVTETGPGESSGYVPTPYPESSYPRPDPTLVPETRYGGSL